MWIVDVVTAATTPTLPNSSSFFFLLWFFRRFIILLFISLNYTLVVCLNYMYRRVRDRKNREAVEHSQNLKCVIFAFVCRFLFCLFFNVGMYICMGIFHRLFSALLLNLLSPYIDVCSLSSIRLWLNQIELFIHIQQWME